MSYGEDFQNIDPNKITAEFISSNLNKIVEKAYSLLRILFTTTTLAGRRHAPRSRSFYCPIYGVHYLSPALLLHII
jgi:hypothetical protein